MGDSRVAAVDRSLATREECIKVLQFHLKRAQDRMKVQSNKGRTDKKFNVGELVYIKLQPYKQMSVVYRSCAKLSPRYFGPFQIMQRIGEVAYKLQLPETSKIHPIFHISQLRKHEGPPPESISIPEVDNLQQLVAEPVAILGRKLAREGNGAKVHLLIQWSNSGPDDATWEPYDEIARCFPEFNLEA
ncbi:uncharacterized protein LOC141628193 [Silene latifolia]|uniref:uncharacterized protein LOC141628193 n=1 Tax=Silene latifolia TaxID=37657 RepID=UPI003D785165